MESQLPASLPREVMLVEHAKRMLVEAQSIDEVKDIRDKAAAVKHYRQQAGECLEAQNAAAEIKIRAERRAGELLREMAEREEREKQGGDRRSKSPEVSLKQPTLKSLGIHAMQSHRWQQVAAVPEPVFEKHIEETKAASKPLTTSGIANLARNKNTDGPSPLNPSQLKETKKSEKPTMKQRTTRKPADCASILATIDQLGEELTTLRQRLEKTNGAFATHRFDLNEQVKRLSLARKLLSQVRSSIKGE